MPQDSENQLFMTTNAPKHSVTLRDAFWVWVKVAIYSFGGPAGQIAVMHRILVEEKRWVSENRFLHALNYCMLLPGPEAQQLATYIGWLLHKTIGGLVAGILFVLPGFISILVLSIFYAGFQDTTFVQALFFGLKPAVMAEFNRQLQKDLQGTSWAGSCTSWYKHADGRISNNWSGNVIDYRKATANFRIEEYEQFRQPETANA